MRPIEQPLALEQAKASLRQLVRQSATFMANKDLGTQPVAWAWEVNSGQSGGVLGRAINDKGRLCVFIAFRDRPLGELVHVIAGVVGPLPLLVDTTGAGVVLLDKLRECGCTAEPLTPPERAAAAASGDGICAVISYAGRKGEPLACGFPAGHAGSHAWATLPTWNGPPTPQAVERVAAAELSGNVVI